MSGSEKNYESITYIVLKLWQKDYEIIFDLKTTQLKEKKNHSIKKILI